MAATNHASGGDPYRFLRFHHVFALRRQFDCLGPARHRIRGTPLCSFVEVSGRGRPGGERGHVVHDGLSALIDLRPVVISSCSHRLIPPSRSFAILAVTAADAPGDRTGRETAVGLPSDAGLMVASSSDDVDERIARPVEIFVGRLALRVPDLLMNFDERLELIAERLVGKQ